MTQTSELGTILLVEDTLDDALLLQRAFRRAGVQNPIRHLPSGDAAFAFLQDVLHDVNESKSGANPLPIPILILLDLNLPGMSGLELLRWIRQQRTLRRIPILVLTGEEDDGYMISAYDAGANSYLLKSVDPGEMERVVQLIGSYWLTLNASPLVVARNL